MWTPAMRDIDRTMASAGANAIAAGGEDAGIGGGLQQDSFTPKCPRNKLKIILPAIPAKTQRKFLKTQ